MLEELFFHKNAVKTIEHFILHEEWEQNQKDLCIAIKTYPKAMKKILDKLERFGLIKETRKIAKSKLFKLNQESNLITPIRLLSRNFGYQQALSKAKLEEKSNVSLKIASENDEEIEINE